MHIRNWTTEDVAFVRHVDLKCFDVGWLDEEWASLVGPNYITFIGCLDTRPVGFLVAERNQQFSRCLKLGVLPQYRNQGMGTQLAGAWALWAQDYRLKKLVVEIPEGLLVGCGEWWVKLGFHNDTLLKNHSSCLGKDEDVLRMVWEAQ